jgi:hypothetical protein
VLDGKLNICMYKALDGTGSGGEEDSSAAFGFGMTILRDEPEGRPFHHSRTTLQAAEESATTGRGTDIRSGSWQISKVLDGR